MSVRIGAWIAVAIAVACSGCANVVVLGHTVHEVTPPAPQGEPVAAATASASATETGTARATPQRSASTSPAVVRIHSLEVGSSAPGVDTTALRSVIEAALRARGLLVEDDRSITSTAALEVTSLETKPTTNAAVFGYRLGAGSIAAKVSVNDATSRELKRFDLIAPSQLRAPADARGADFPLAPLYRGLADRVADQLAGTPGRTEDIARSETPR